MWCLAVVWQYNQTGKHALPFFSPLFISLCCLLFLLWTKVPTKEQPVRCRRLLRACSQRVGAQSGDQSA